MAVIPATRTGTLGNTEYAADKISQEQYLYYGTAIDAQRCDSGHLMSVY